jgi:hypothetical protein
MCINVVTYNQLLNLLIANIMLVVRNYHKLNQYEANRV